jgi:hypothetical protein
MHAPVSVGGNRDSDNSDAENQHDNEGTCAHPGLRLLSFFLFAFCLFPVAFYLVPAPFAFCLVLVCGPLTSYLPRAEPELNPPFMLRSADVAL